MVATRLGVLWDAALPRCDDNRGIERGNSDTGVSGSWPFWGEEGGTVVRGHPVFSTSLIGAANSSVYISDSRSVFR